MHIGTQYAHWDTGHVSSNPALEGHCPAEFSSNPDKNSTAWYWQVTLKTLISLLFVNYWHIKQITSLIWIIWIWVNKLYTYKLHIFGFCWIVNNYFIFIIKRFAQELTVNCKHSALLKWNVLVCVPLTLLNYNY